MLELGAVVSSLSAEDGDEDANHDVIDVISGVLDDGVSEEEDDSDILEAVGGQQEGISGPFNGVTDLDGGDILVASFDHLLSLGDQGEEFSLGFEVVALGKKITYVLELFEFGVNLGLDTVEDLGNAFVLSGELHGGSGQEADKEGGKDNSLHLVIKLNDK